MKIDNTPRCNCTTGTRVRKGEKHGTRRRLFLFATSTTKSLQRRRAERKIHPKNKGKSVCAYRCIGDNFRIEFWTLADENREQTDVPEHDEAENFWPGVYCYGCSCWCGIWIICQKRQLDFDI